MTSRPGRSTPGGAAYLDLRKLATHTHRPTDELHQLYALEGFLDRLTRSSHSERFILKGGVLLAAYSERRPTKDIDFVASQIQADHDSIREIVNDILGIEVDDGLEFDLGKTSVEEIRDLDAYPGVRSKISGSLATANIRFHVDINIGDPLWPEPREIELPRLLEIHPAPSQGLLGRARARREDRDRPSARQCQHQMARFRRHRSAVEGRRRPECAR